MLILFAPRKKALDQIQAFYEIEIVDTPDCAGELIDLVIKEVIRIPDPATGAPKGSMIPGKAWAPEYSVRVPAAFTRLNKFTEEEA